MFLIRQVQLDDLWERFLKRRRWTVFEQIPSLECRTKSGSTIRELSRKGEGSGPLVFDDLF